MIQLRRYFAWSVYLSIVGYCSAQNTPTITPKDAASNVGKTVTVQGLVVRVGHSSGSNVYFLNFTSDKGGFTAVIPNAKYNDMMSAGIDINAIEGKNVTVTGQIIKDPKYGIEMNLNDPATQLVLPNTATDVKYAKGIISVEDAPKYVGQYATIQGKVVSVNASKTGTTYFLRLTAQQKGFTVVIFPSLEAIYKKANIDLKSFAGKTIQVNGNIKFYEQYGYEIILDKTEDLKEVKQ